MSHTVSGPFTVVMVPQPADEFADASTLGRMTLDKTFSGPLSATSKGQMLTGMGTVQGSAGYVAIERPVGTLDGKRGAFILQHSGTMTRGVGVLTLTVVPDSGTDELTGLTGSMDIDVVDGVHQYTFRYDLHD